jgi:hypothetical protein
MPTSLRVSVAVALLALSFGLGYSLSPSRPVDPPTRAVTGSAPPPGIASELQAALVLPDLLDRVAAVARILEPLGPGALDEVQKGYESVNLDLGDVELVLLADWWAGFDPSAAFGWARDSKIGWHPAVLTAMVRTWARRDPEAAARSIRATLQDDRLMTAAMVGLVHGWDESGRGGLETYLSGLPAGSLRAVDVLARIRIAREGPELAFEWAQELPATLARSPSGPRRSSACWRPPRTRIRVSPPRGPSRSEGRTQGPAAPLASCCASQCAGRGRTARPR